VSNARLRLAFTGETMEDPAHMLGKPPGFPGRHPLVRFADEALRGFPTPLHAHSLEASL
jgi:hypothetical protein